MEVATTKTGNSKLVNKDDKITISLKTPDEKKSFVEKVIADGGYFRNPEDGSHLTDVDQILGLLHNDVRLEWWLPTEDATKNCINLVLGEECVIAIPPLQ